MLRKLLFFILCFLIPPNFVDAREFTDEQKQILEYVKKYGGYHKREVAAIIIQESFVGDKVVRKGDKGKAHGIGQMHIPTAKHTLKHFNKNINQDIKNKLLTDDEYAVKMTVKYYKYLMKKFRYDRNLAILAYNVGPTKIQKTGLNHDPNNYLKKVLNIRKTIIKERIL